MPSTPESLPVRSPRVLPSLLVTLLAAVPTGAVAQTDPAGGDPTGEARIRLSGELLRTAAEPGRPSQAAVKVGERIVPVTGSPVQQVRAGATVTVDVEVPAEVAEAADEGSELRVETGRGSVVTHQLEPADLEAASDASPAAEDSALAAASVDSALAPGADALTVDEVVGTTTRSAAVSGDPATRTLTVVRVRPKGVTATMPTESAVRSQVADADAHWQDSASGRVRLRLGRLAPAQTSAYTCGEYWSMWDDVARRVGYTQARHTSLVLVLPRSSSCSHGLGTVGSDTGSGGYVYTSGAVADSLAHEIGHNMSLQHADRLVCDSRSDARHVSDHSWGPRCTQEGYGDGQDIMGIDDMATPSALLSTPQGLRTGLLPAAAQTRVGRGTRTVRLAPLSSGRGTRVATVTDEGTGVTYYVEYRRPSGRDRYNSWGHRTGVRVLRVNPRWGESVLLDPTPTGLGTDRDLDPVLAPGASLRTYDRGITFTTVSTSATGAVVRIANSATPRTFARVGEPRVTGSRGVGRTLTADAGAWSPAPTRITYQWKRNGIRIPDATAPVYTPTTADAGRYVSVAVTVRRAGYVTTTRTSPRVGIPMHATTRPSVIGTPKVGRGLYAKVGSWTPRPTSYAYQWYRGSTRIAGATGKTYTLRPADAGHRVRVRVTARRSGYSTGAAYSGSSATVAR